MKVGEDLQNRLLQRDLIPVQPVNLPLTGIYRNSNGDALHFMKPRFTWTMPDRVVSGGYAIFSVGSVIVVFKEISDQGIAREHQTFLLDYSEESQGDRTIRTIVLAPASLDLLGVQQITESTLRFQQVEIDEEKLSSSR